MAGSAVGLAPGRKLRLGVPAVVCLSAVTILALGLPSGAAGKIDARPGTIAYMLGERVGSEVALDAMMLRQVGDGRLIVCEPMDPKQTVLVMADISAKPPCSVEVRGTLACSEESGMYIDQARVWGYANSTGKLYPFFPKSMTGYTEWENMVELTGGGTETMSPDPEPSASEDLADATPLARLKSLPDGTQARVIGKYISARNLEWWGDDRPLSHLAGWVLEADRSAGMRLHEHNITTSVYASLVSLSATVATVAGEKVLTNVDNVTLHNAPYDKVFVPPSPMGMPNRSIGGPGLPDPHPGLSSLGQLVTVWGRAEQVASDYYYTYIVLDDGSQTPLRVDVPYWSGLEVSEDDYVRVTGIADVTYRHPDSDDLSGLPSNAYIRRIACRDEEDVTPIGDPDPGGAAHRGSITGHLLADEEITGPVKVYTAYGSTTVAPEAWVYDDPYAQGRWCAEYALSGVPGEPGTTQVGLVTAKTPGFASVWRFVTPRGGANPAANIDFELTDTSVRSLTLDDPDPASAACGEDSVVTARLWDLEGYPLGGYSVFFEATNGEFVDTQTNQTTKVTDEDGYATAVVSPTNGDTITVAVSHDVLQEQAAVEVDKEALRIWSSPRLDDPGGEVTVYAKLTLRGAPVQNATIAFTADAGGSVDPSQDQTNSEGIAETTFYANWSGDPKVTASHTNGCGWQTSLSLGHAVDIVFCVDASGSMWATAPVHVPTASIRALLDDLEAEGVTFRAGAILFSDYQAALLVRSLADYTNLTTFHAWLDANDQQSGADENPLTAMDRAVDDVTAHSAGGTRPFIVLVTDEPYNVAYQSVTREELVARLHAMTDGLGGAYLSFWEDPAIGELCDMYMQQPSLAVNGSCDAADYAQSDPPLQYPFSNVRERVLQGTE